MKSMHAQKSAVEISIGDKKIMGDQQYHRALKVSCFAHGSGSSRFSPRNKYVADILHESNIAHYSSTTHRGGRKYR